MIPAWGPPRSLSPLKVTTSAPSRMASWTVGSPLRPNCERSRKEPLPRSSTTGMPRPRPSAASSPRVTSAVNPIMRVVAGVNSQQDGRAFGDGSFIIAQVSAVGAPHLPEDGPARAHDVRDAEGTPDFHELSPGHHHFFPRGQGVQDEENRPGVVVHHQGRLGAGEFPEDGFGVDVPRSPLSFRQVVFQVVVAAADGLEASRGFFGQEGPPEIGVDHDPRAVDDGLQGIVGHRFQPVKDEFHQVRRVEVHSLPRLPGDRGCVFSWHRGPGECFRGPGTGDDGSVRSRRLPFEAGCQPREGGRRNSWAVVSVMDLHPRLGLHLAASFPRAIRLYCILRDR